MEELKIKDFIIDINKAKAKIDKEQSNKINNVEYELKLENDMDFVINRKTSKTDKDLVFLVSQDLFYIKDNKTEEIIQLDSENVKRKISPFLKDLEKWILFEKVTWTKNCNSDNLAELLRDTSRKDILRLGLGDVRYYDREIIIKYAKANKKLIQYAYKKLGEYDRNTLRCVYFILDKYNYNNAKYFIDLLHDTKMGCYYGSDIVNIIEKYPNFDTNTFLEYITHGFLAQGITDMNGDIKNCYNDYLDMTNEMYGKIRCKYPKYLKTEHDKVVLKYNLWRKYKDDLALIEISEEHKELAYSDREYSIIIPENSADIVSEGVNNNNCVASYINRITKGETIVVFMRETRSIDESLVTIEVSDKTVCQVKGYANRKITVEEDKFVKKWAKLKKLKTDY